MSRKDYREIADSLRFLKETSLKPEEWDVIIGKFVQLFKKDNPRFSAKKFWDYIERQ